MIDNHFVGGSYRFLFAAIFCLLLSGCGSNPPQDADALANAQLAYDQAIAEFEAGNSDEALEQLNIALKPGGGLQADLYVDARIKRAVCFALSDQYEAAHADLDNASEGAGDMSVVHAARSFVFAKEGKSKESKAEMSKAKKINRTVKPFR